MLTTRRVGKSLMRRGRTINARQVWCAYVRTPSTARSSRTTDWSISLLPTGTRSGLCYVRARAENLENHYFRWFSRPFKADKQSDSCHRLEYTVLQVWVQYKYTIRGVSRDILDVMQMLRDAIFKSLGSPKAVGRHVIFSVCCKLRLANSGWSPSRQRCSGRQVPHANALLYLYTYKMWC